MTRWRVGRSPPVGRTLYRDEVFVGTVDSAEIALEIVEAMNAAEPLVCCTCKLTSAEEPSVHLRNDGLARCNSCARDAFTAR